MDEPGRGRTLGPAHGARRSSLLERAVNRTPRALLLLIAVAVLPLPVTNARAQKLDAPATHAPPSDPGRAACDVGIAVAFHADLARAESVFVGLLAQSPGDPRALNDLGNLNLMRGEPDLAMAFYERAASADTTDAGILLNQATALLALGENEAAAKEAAYATERAGGVQAAARLLGLRVESEGDAAKGAAKTRMTQEEILSLLRSAATAVPPESLRARGAAQMPDVKNGGGRTRKAPVWRAAGARAGDQDIASVLCWKR